MNFINKIKRKFVSFCANWLYSSIYLEEKDSMQQKEKRNDETSPDFIDYDGMGNQGRFPSRRKK